VRLKVLASLWVAGGSAAAAWWASPALLASAFLVAWAAEAAQFLMPQGLALALLAWLQTSPEFAVEAVIAWDAGTQPARAQLAIANLTGAIRLLLGLGWPLVYGVYALAQRRRGRDGFPPLLLERDHAVALAALVAALAYFAIIVAKGAFGAGDAGVLLAVYGAYLWLLARQPTRPMESAHDAPAAARWALKHQGWRRGAAIGALFASGGLLLIGSVRPFLEALLALATLAGLSQFFVVQWVAPVLSEFPEMVSTVTWARRVTPAPMALMNLVSSNLNQWTVLAAMIPLVFGYAHWRHDGTWAAFHFDRAQQLELGLALLQTGLGVLLLATMEFGARAAALLFLLWLVQFLMPGWRLAVGAAYAAWIAVLILLFATGRLPLRAAAWLPGAMRLKRDRPDPRIGARPAKKRNGEDY